MKKAFTLIELIFVIVVIGIIATVSLPNLNKNNLSKAAIQVASHIRYTQHLAMMDDKFSTSENIWYKKRWRLKFSNSVNTNDKWSYSIFDDRSGDASGNPDSDEVAINPLNRNKKLTGGAAGDSMIYSGDPEATDEMNIGQEYGVLDIDFRSDCRTANTNKVVTFDHMGRPIRGTTSNLNSAYISSTNGTNILISSQCVIDLCSVEDCNDANADEIVSIAIEPETGYISIL